MKQKKDNPGAPIPPPLFYVLIFFISILMQHYISLSEIFFEGIASRYLSIFFIVLGVGCVFPALLTFLKTKNTLITILPAKSLQTKGIYSISRNPMYLGLLFAYIGIGFIKGNWWTLVLIPIVILVVNHLVIIKEEKYLMRAFGETYLHYKIKVRRWI